MTLFGMVVVLLTVDKHKKVHRIQTSYDLVMAKTSFWFYTFLSLIFCMLTWEEVDVAS